MRLIDADALVENIKGYSQIEGTKLSKADEKIIECFISHVEMLEPTIEAKPVVHGEWIFHKWAEEKEGLLVPNFECSQCHTWKRDKTDFCPDCGTDMREGLK